MKEGYLKLAQDFYNAYLSTMTCWDKYMHYKEKATNGIH